MADEKIHPTPAAEPFRSGHTRMETIMGEAREVTDRLDAAMIAGDWEAAAGCYAIDAVFTTPDAGELVGREAITKYFRAFAEAFPDNGFEAVQEHESGNSAIDEEYITGTHTGPLILRPGRSIPPTGKKIRLRSCDVVQVEDGLITTHRFYFDQLEFLAQLGLLPDDLS